MAKERSSYEKNTPVGGALMLPWEHVNHVSITTIKKHVLDMIDDVAFQLDTLYPEINSI
jgi:hypothetical protein